jgi:hypothetical protein
VAFRADVPDIGSGGNNLPPIFGCELGVLAWFHAGLGTRRSLWRALAYIGAPWSMKMGNIPSPQRYDVGTYDTPP